MAANNPEHGEARRQTAEHEASIVVLGHEVVEQALGSVPFNAEPTGRMVPQVIERKLDISKLPFWWEEPERKRPSHYRNRLAQRESAPLGPPRATVFVSISRLNLRAHSCHASPRATFEAQHDGERGQQLRPVITQEIAGCNNCLEHASRQSSLV